MEPEKKKSRFPLWAQVLAGVTLGTALGAAVGPHPIVFGVGVEQLGDLGMLVIRLIKAVAVPLVLFSILDAVLRFSIPTRKGAALLAICAVNACAALAIALLLVNLLAPGDGLRGALEAVTRSGATAAPPPGATLSPMKTIEGLVPEALAQPFVENNVIGVVVVALLAGAALRRVRENRGSPGAGGVAVVEQLVATAYQALVEVLGWVVRAVPFAAFGLCAKSVGRSGLEIFASLWIFLAVIGFGLVIHAFVYYPLVAWIAGGKHPREFLGGGADAVFTGVAANSSLAAVPVTLHCLTERMGVSPSSARMAACVGTNFNNDGITLYEAMAALLLAQACGMELGIAGQVQVVFAAVMAGIGIAGVPESGLVVLPLVLAASGLPEPVVAASIPLIVPVDWILARLRSAVNVLSDMLVAVLLDRQSDVAPEGEASALAAD